MKAITFQAIVDGVQTRKDGTLSIKLGTQELGPEESAHVFHYANKLSWVAIKEMPVNEEDLEIPEGYTPEFPSDKSPSQRLRAVLYVLWKQGHDTGKTKKSADQFYRDYMTGIINNVKELLD